MFDPDLAFDPFIAEGTAASLALLQSLQQDPRVEQPDQDTMSTATATAAGTRSKGKGVASRPVPIPSPAHDPHDIFDMHGARRADQKFYAFASPLSSSPPSWLAGSPSASSSSSSSPWAVGAMAVSMPDPRAFPGVTAASESFSFLSPSEVFPLAGDASGSGKGKARAREAEEHPPTLPPLVFSPSVLGDEHAYAGWLTTPSPGPSGSGSISPSHLQPPASPPLTPTPISVLTTDPEPRRRRRSLPSLARTRIRSGIAKRLLFKYTNDSACPTPPSSPTTGDLDPGTGAYSPWRTGDSGPGALDYGHYAVVKVLPGTYPTCALDLVPAVASSDVFSAIPLPVWRDCFGEMLPRELQVLVMRAVVDVHDLDQRKLAEDGSWTIGKATSAKNQWVGRNRGMRDLVRFSRVSKSWQSLVFDGQIWSDIDLSAFPLLPKALLIRLASHVGAFAQSLDISGHGRVGSSALVQIADHLAYGFLPLNNLTSLNLRGCSGITTQSLHHLLIQSRALERVCLHGLSAVTNMTCDILGSYCTGVQSLDLGRCKHLDAYGLKHLVRHKVDLPLRELRISGVKYIDDDVMRALGKAAPFLEVLDLSYMRHLHNTAIEAFVAAEEGQDNSITLNAREAGRDFNDGTHYRRRITRLRHLVLSSCILLTDAACSHLAHTMPNLEYLELAGIGASLEDAGLIRLLDTTPKLKRLDLEDASSITDAVLATLTPPLPEGDEAPAQSALDTLILSGALEVTDDALLALVRGCTRLRVLEIDNTHIGARVLKTFVRLCRQRALHDARIVGVDCRGFGESLIRELSPQTRPRHGWRDFGARGLEFVDARDAEEYLLKVGQDECDPARVVVQTFHGWQTVDAVHSAREKRRKASMRRSANEAEEGRSRWWSPSGRQTPDDTVQDNGCLVM